MNQTLQNTLAKLGPLQNTISEERKALLRKIAGYISEKLAKRETVKMSFICTENSRRSHLSHLISAAIIKHFGLPIQTFSGGTKVSACNPRTIAALERAGFIIEKPLGDNPKYRLVLNRMTNRFSRTANYTMLPKTRKTVLLPSWCAAMRMQTALSFPMLKSALP